MSQSIRSSNDLKSVEVRSVHIERSQIFTPHEINSETVSTSFVLFPVGEKEKNLRYYLNSNERVFEPKLTTVR